MRHHEVVQERRVLFPDLVLLIHQPHLHLCPQSRSRRQLAERDSRGPGCDVTRATGVSLGLPTRPPAGCCLSSPSNATAPLSLVLSLVNISHCPACKSNRPVVRNLRLCSVTRTHKRSSQLSTSVIALAAARSCSLPPIPVTRTRQALCATTGVPRRCSRRQGRIGSEMRRERTPVPTHRLG